MKQNFSGNFNSAPLKNFLSCAYGATILSFFNTSWNIRMTKASKLLINFFLTTMASELSKYLNEQLGVFLNVKQQK